MCFSPEVFLKSDYIVGKCLSSLSAFGSVYLSFCVGLFSLIYAGPIGGVVTHLTDSQEFSQYIFSAVMTFGCTVSQS